MHVRNRKELPHFSWLRLKLRDYSIENARLKGDKGKVQSDLAQERIDHTKTQARGWFDRLRNRFSA